MRPKWFVPGMVFMLVMALTSLCHAEILTFVMEGPVQDVHDPWDWGIIQVGDRAVYTFTFDSEAPNRAYPPSGGAGSYDGISTTLHVGSVATQADNLWIGVRYGSADAFQVSSGQLVEGVPLWPPGSLSNSFTMFRLVDMIGQWGPELPSEPYPLNSFAWTQFTGTINGPPSPNHPTGENLNFSGYVDSFYRIPEPASILLLAWASLLGLRRYR